MRKSLGQKKLCTYIQAHTFVRIHNYTRAVELSYSTRTHGGTSQSGAFPQTLIIDSFLSNHNTASARAPTLISHVHARCRMVAVSTKDSLDLPGTWAQLHTRCCTSRHSARHAAPARHALRKQVSATATLTPGALWVRRSVSKSRRRRLWTTVCQKKLPQQNYPSFVGRVRILDKNIWHFWESVCG